MSEGKTPRTLDQVLASWPEPERKEIEWTPNAAPSARFAELTDDELLGPPLPGSEASGPVAASSGGRDKGRSKQHLQDLAKLAEMKPAPEPKEKEENSGVVHLAALAASEGQNIDGTPLQPAAAPAASTATKEPGKTGSSSRPSWLMVSGLVAAAAVVALFFGMQHPGTEAPVQVTVVAPAVQPPTPTPTSAATATATNKEPLDKAVDPSTLPPADTSVAAGAHPTSPAAVAAASPAKPAPAPAASATPDPALADKPATPAANGSPVNLESAMQQAAGPQSTFSGTPTATATEAPAAAPSNIGLKPSQGAINGALGAALPAARACLGPDDPISRATVTFQSDGTVQSVSVTGGAAGKPAEACIRSALMHAKVPPFAMPTFTAPATIRPN
jgi:hypothetical protein